MPSFSIRNFGCRVNQAEAFAWAGTLRGRGLRLEDDPEKSDLVVVNACTLTARADRDVRRFVARIVRRDPAPGLVVTGCLADGMRAELAEMPQVRLVLPNREKHRLTNEVLALVGDKRAYPVSPASVEGAGEDTAPAVAVEAETLYRSRGLLKVQDGCDNACAFCVIPGVRGRSASVAPADVLERVRDLVGRGYREIVLAGIHLSSYGRDLEPRITLLELLREIEKVPGLGRLRLSSLDPRLTDRALIEHIAGNPKVCEHFHLSLQHASPRVLREMGRGTAADAREALLAGIRERSPEAAIGTDLIVGFPGETADDFALLEDFVKRSPLTYLHIFSYSPRPGTPAASRPQLPGRVKRERAVALRRLAAEKNRRFQASFIGRELEGVVIRPRKERKKPAITVLTGNAIRVSVAAGAAVPRAMVRVRIERITPQALEGVVVE